MITDRLEVALILAAYATGDEEWGRTAGWAEEFAHLVAVHPAQLAALIRSVAAEGVREPITLGHDGRVLDGHHRLLASVIAGREDIPVERFIEDPSA